MAVPHITIEQASVLYTNAEPMLKLSNELIDKHNARTDQATEQYITADEARKLGAGKAEICNELGNWIVCQGNKYGYPNNGKYRAIKQPEPVEDDAGFLKRFKENIKADVDRSLATEPHAELKAMYEQQVKDGTLDDFVWEYLPNYAQWNWLGLNGKTLIPTMNKQYQYRCTPKPTCQVGNLDTGKLKTMTREAAKKLQAELGDAVEWKTPMNMTGATNDNLSFCQEGIYTYKLRGTVKLTIDDNPAKMLTLAQCEVERLARINTHDVVSKLNKSYFIITNPEWNNFQTTCIEYHLVPKPLKQVSWTSVPLGVAVREKKTKSVWLHQGISKLFKQALAIALPHRQFAWQIDLEDLELAPASEQPWIAVQDDGDFILKKCFEYHKRYNAADDCELIAFRITGLAEGYELK